MKLSSYLESRGWTKSDLAKRLGVSKVLVGKWDEIPEKYLEVLEADLPEGVAYRDWWTRGDRLFWKVGSEVREYGHGSVWDYEYSMAKIDFIKDLLRSLGSVQAVVEWIGMFPAEFIRDVEKGVVCPNVVDMKKPRLEGGDPVPQRVEPW